MEKRSLLDQLVHGFASVIGDVRDKVVLEGWFGKSDAPAAGNPGAPINPPAQPMGVNRTNIDLHVETTVNVGSINIDMRQQNMSAPMRSWDDICAEMGPVRGNAPEPDREHGLDR